MEDDDDNDDDFIVYFLGNCYFKRSVLVSDDISVVLFIYLFNFLVSGAGNNVYIIWIIPLCPPGKFKSV